MRKAKKCDAQTGRRSKCPIFARFARPGPWPRCFSGCGIRNGIAIWNWNTRSLFRSAIGRIWEVAISTQAQTELTTWGEA